MAISWFQLLLSLRTKTLGKRTTHKKSTCHWRSHFYVSVAILGTWHDQAKVTWQTLGTWLPLATIVLEASTTTTWVYRYVQMYTTRIKSWRTLAEISFWIWNRLISYLVHTHLCCMHAILNLEWIKHTSINDYISL